MYYIWDLLSFDEDYETREVFLDISKTLDKVWLKVLLHKLKNGILGSLLNIATDFSYQLKQKVVFNGQYSWWTTTEAELLQVCTLGQLLFLIYINDLSNDLASNPKLFADDTSLFSRVKNMIKSANNYELANITTGSFQWKLNFNPDSAEQAQEVIFSRKH